MEELDHGGRLRRMRVSLSVTLADPIRLRR
jgi:hypothetical protein